MNVVVTGGGTIAPIDDVRQIANVSSGRFSARLTEASLRRGASVWHVHAPSAELPFLREARFDLAAADLDAEHARLDDLARRWREARDRLHLIPLRLGTVADYAETLERALRARPIDVALLAMAVSDFEPEPVPGKLGGDAESLVVRGWPTPKVIRSVRDWAPSVYLVGFKLQSNVDREALIRQARDACLINRADVTVANDLRDVKAGRHKLYLVRPGCPTVVLEPGADLADRLVENVWEWAAI
jgi:phosphopantothenate-cysteine ligase